MSNTFEKRKKVIYDFICDDLYVPMKLKEIAMVLGVPKEQKEELKKVLDTLVEDGKITLSKRGKYTKGQTKRFTGVFQAHPRGFGFVIREGVDEDVFISEENINGAFQGDEVEFIITKSSEAGRRTEGKVVRILSHSTTKIVGLYEKCKSYGFVRPDNQRILSDIYIPEGKEKGAMTGHKVVVSLTSYGGERMKPEGVVTEIIGHINDPGTDIISIVKGFDLPMEFSERVMNQAERVAKEVSEADRAGRMDLRTWKMVTIDGEDAKDLDDAVSLTKEGENYQLGVHIADVTNYVQERSALDREALNRGTSVYLVDRVIPMLPKKLSNGICSLNAGEDRLALSCLMTIDEKGKVIAHKIAETVIRVNERMSYTDVKKILLKEDETVTERYKDLVPMFFQMGELSQILRKRRKKRGSIDFDFPESKILLDDMGKPVEIYAYEHNVATELIEDFMLTANETVAEEYALLGLPFLYRTHENPDGEKIEAALSLVHQAGVKVKKAKENIAPKEIQKILKELQGMDCEPFLSRLILRSMKQAKYTVDCTGHFGLAAKYYCHFTSPIRRYPDLQIHRIIKENLRGKMSEAKIRHYDQILEEVARQSSAMERRAEEVERETVKMKKAEFMKQHVGETFEGVISGVTEWGLYVELENTVEGLVHVNTMTDDYYTYDREQYLLKGDMTKKVYAMGQKVKVRVEGADIQTRSIDFSLEREE